MVRVILALLVAALGTASALGARAPDSVRSRTVPCDEIIDVTPFPDRGNAQPQYRNRPVLDAISVPPAFIPQVSSTGERPWRYFSKWGMASALTRDRCPSPCRRAGAIGWRSRGGTAVTASSRGFASRAAGTESVGDAYAGGFFLRARSACVPLTFWVGGRTATVRFGIGRHCA